MSALAPDRAPASDVAALTAFLIDLADPSWVPDASRVPGEDALAQACRRLAALLEMERAGSSAQLRRSEAIWALEKETFGLGRAAADRLVGLSELAASASHTVTEVIHGLRTTGARSREAVAQAAASRDSVVALDAPRSRRITGSRTRSTAAWKASAAGCAARAM